MRGASAVAAANTLSFTCRGVNQTHRLARALAGWVQVGDVVLLSGDLGAGKTTFMKGVAAGLGVSDAVTSPTFALAHQYHTALAAADPTAAADPDPAAAAASTSPPGELLHIDLYRLDDPREMLDYISEELSEMAAFVEWGDRLADEFPDNRLEIAIGFAAQTPNTGSPEPDDPDTRTIELTGVGTRWQNVWQELSENLSASLSAALP